MIGLGIESTAHTFSCAIIEKKGKKGKILSDVRKIFRPEAGQGIHPREASRHHIENSPLVLSECLNEANISVKDLEPPHPTSTTAAIVVISMCFICLQLSILFSFEKWPIISAQGKQQE